MDGNQQIYQSKIGTDCFSKGEFYRFAYRLVDRDVNKAVLSNQWTTETEDEMRGIIRAHFIPGYVYENCGKGLHSEDKKVFEYLDSESYRLHQNGSGRFLWI